MQEIQKLMQSQFNSGFYSKDELLDLGFKSVGESVLISKKAIFYGISKISIGDFVRIDDFVIISGSVSLGSFVHIGAFASITGGNGVESSVSFGDFCGMSSYSKIFATSDDFVNGYLVGPCVPQDKRHVIYSHIVLERHCHIGSHSLVLPNSYFEIGASLGAASLNMGRRFKSWSYYFGNPAKKIYDISMEQVLAKEQELFLSK